jgi:adenylate kinase family enzyme
MGRRYLAENSTCRSASLDQNPPVGLLVVTGPPGAGKSTVAEALAHRFEPSVLVAGDDLFAFLRRGAIQPWLAESDHQNTVVTRAAAAAAGTFASGGFHVIYDGVIGPWYVATFAEAVGLESFDYVVLLPSEERCVARVASRLDHGFTDEDATRHMHRQFASRWPASVDARHILVEPPDGVDETARLILDEARAGRLDYRTP